jgi:hypothetical protein
MRELLTELAIVLMTVVILSPRILERIVNSLLARYKPRVKIVTPTGKQIIMYRSEVTSEKIKEIAQAPKNIA